MTVRRTLNFMSKSGAVVTGLGEPGTGCQGARIGLLALRFGVGDFWLRANGASGNGNGRTQGVEWWAKRGLLKPVNGNLFEKRGFADIFVLRISTQGHPGFE